MYIYGQLDLSKVWANLLSHQQSHSLYPLHHFLYQFHPFPTFKDGTLPRTTGGPTDRPQAQLANWHKHWQSLQERQRELSPGRTWNRKGPETHTGEMSWGRVLPPHIQTTQEMCCLTFGPSGWWHYRSQGCMKNKGWLQSPPNVPPPAPWAWLATIRQDIAPI